MRTIALPILLLLTSTVVSAQGPRTGNTPVTVGEGSILITTDSQCPFDTSSGGCWQIADGATSFSKSHVIETRNRKFWKEIKAKPKGGSDSLKSDCTKKDGCLIVATYSDGTIVTLSQMEKHKGIRLASSRVFGDYALGTTTLEYSSGSPTLQSAFLLKTEGSKTEMTDLCYGISKCQVTVDHDSSAQRRK